MQAMTWFASNGSQSRMRWWLAVLAAAVLALAGVALPGESAAGGRTSAAAKAAGPPFAYVANVGFDGTVSVVATATHSIIDTIPVGHDPIALAVTPNGRSVYVANSHSPGTVSVIDTASDSVVDTIAVGDFPHSVAVTPDGSRVYVTNDGSNSVSVIATASDTVVDTIQLDTFPIGVAVSPDGSRVYVTAPGASSMLVIATASDTVVDTIPVAGYPWGAAVAPDGAHVYVTDRLADEVSVIATASDTVVATVPVGEHPSGVAVTPDSAHVYVADLLSNTVSVVATASNTVVDTVHVGVNPWGVAVTPDGGHAYVTNINSGSVSVIATASNTVVETIDGFRGPYGIAIGPAGTAPFEPPALAVAPSAYTSNGQRYVVYTGPGGSVWQQQVGSPAPAIALGGRLVSGPAPINAGGRRIVFGQGSNHQLWQKVDGGPWTSLGGRLTSKPGAAVESAEVYRVYVRGAEGAVWGRDHTAAGWGAWRRVGGALLPRTGPAAAVHDGGFYVLAVGTNRALFLAHDQVTGFTSAAGDTAASPALVDAPSSGSLVGFALGPNRAGRYHRFLPATPGWHNLGGTLTSGTGGTADAGHWYAYGLGTDSQVWEHPGTTTQTGPWTRVTP